jgi:tetratricopeptide (TPR) repeat protein
MRKLAAAGVCIFLIAATSAVVLAQLLPVESDRRRAVEHYWSGQQWLAAERWDRAVNEFHAALKLHPLLTDAHYGLGQAHMGAERYVSAARAFQACLTAARTLHDLRDKARVDADREILEEVDEIRDTVRRRRGESLRVRQLEQHIATRLRQRSSLGLPFEPPAPVLLALGSAHFRNGDRTRAEYYWREATRIDDSLGEAWNNLAAIFAANARRDEAQLAVHHAERAGFRVNPRLKAEIQAIK